MWSATREGWYDVDYRLQDGDLHINSTLITERT